AATDSLPVVLTPGLLEYGLPVGGRSGSTALGLRSHLRFICWCGCRLTERVGVSARTLYKLRGLVIADQATEIFLIDQKDESTSTDMPLGTAIHNIEITLGKGGQLARAAGAVAKLIAKEGKSATLKLPSGEVRLISKNCSATVGQVGNVGANQKSLGRAGSKCWLGKRPVVRGVVMNPVDHPHGGGEGRAPIGRKRPATPWGYPALGRRSRKRNKYSDNLILRRRSKKKEKK
ncbi:hypothetical protein CUMW_279450, partial [Citrus unshiu]